MPDQTGPTSACPIPTFGSGHTITLAHGEGARLARALIRQELAARLANPTLEQLGDAATLPSPSDGLAFTTDSYVVSPRFFPGGDIGTLSVNGTVNDLLVAGARPRWLSLALVIEEGFQLEELRYIIDRIAAAAHAADVQVVTGDTKVVGRGAADGLFINTAGIGELIPPVPPGPQALQVGDTLLISGPVGCHGIAVLAAREQLGLEPPPCSDCASLQTAIAALRLAGIPTRAMRDATRGGLTAVLHEWALASKLTLAIDESAVPVTPAVRGAAELLGLDPLQIACEGAMLVAVPPGVAEQASAAFRATPIGQQAAVIGEVRPAGVTKVVVRRASGIELALDEPMGAALPRIC